MTEITYRGYKIVPAAHGGLMAVRSDSLMSFAAPTIDRHAWADGERRRPALWASSGLDLDQWGAERELPRHPGEPDAGYRGRIGYALLKDQARQDHDAAVTIGHKSRVYPLAGIALGALAWIVLIGAVMALKHWVFG